MRSSGSTLEEKSLEYLSGIANSGGGYGIRAVVPENDPHLARIHTASVSA